MKKFLFAFLLIIIMGTSTNQAFAESIEPEVAISQEVLDGYDITQEEIDRRMEIVFDYLNKHANSVDFNGQNFVTFDIPVGEGVIVSAEISNQESLKTKAIGSSTFYVSANTTYNYNLTLNNVVGSGDTTVYTVNYTVGNPVASGKDVYWLTVNKVSIEGTAPSGFSLGNSSTWIGNTNGTLIVDTGGYIKYTRVILTDKTINFNRVTLGSVAGSKVIVDYSYAVN